MTRTFEEINTYPPDLNLIAQPDVSTPSRAFDIKNTNESIFVTLYQIDETLINYIDHVIKPSINDNDRVVPVEVIYASPERWKSIRKDGFMRDPKNDKLQTPLIALRRTAIARNGLTNPSNKYVYQTHKLSWNKNNAYDRFALQNNIQPSEQFNNVIVPDYVDLTYEVLLWTEYQEQMNHLVEQINVENDEWWGLRNQYKFRVRIDNYDNQNELPAENQRFVRTTFNMKVSAYLVPERMVKNFVPSATNQKMFSSKKFVTFIEVDQTGGTPAEGYYARMNARQSNVTVRQSTTSIGGGSHGSGGGESSYVFAENVRPGYFAPGSYTFPENMTVLGTTSLEFISATGSLCGGASYAVSASYASNTVVGYDNAGDITPL